MQSRLEVIQNTKDETDIDIDYTKEEMEDYESSPPSYSITTYPADFTLEVLYEKWKKKDIIIPPFQRKFVWSQIQSSKLIESFLTGLPVPSIFLYTEKETNLHLVIDGQQRLKSIFYFFEGFFGEEIKGKRTTFRLKGLNEKSKWYSKSFEELADYDQRKIKNSVLRSFIVNQLNPRDDTSIYHIFERLNTGGTLLSNQEIRNCVYHGGFNNILHQLNITDEWRDILGKIEEDSRQRDVELILRFFTFLNVGEYEPPFKEYLTKYMSTHRDESKEFLDNLKNLFINTCRIIISKLGKKPFHIIRGINTAVLDSVMISIANNIDSIPENLSIRYQSLLEDKDYKFNISGPISNPGVLKERFKIAKKYLID